MAVSSPHLAAQYTTRLHHPDMPAHEIPIVPAGYFRISPAISWVLAAVLVLPALPIILLAVIVIRLSSPGPGIFRQLRVGHSGKTYMMYKLRTMRVDAEVKTGAVWTQPGDPRVTRLGRILRRLHIDELPQLFNVLRGEMALIGPRPERPEFVCKLAPVIPGYLNRLAVLPGVTGLAQINLPPDSTIDSVRDKLVVDLAYIETGGAWMDVRIYLCTLLRMFGIRGTVPARMLGLWQAPQIPRLRQEQAQRLGLRIPTPQGKGDEVGEHEVATCDGQVGGKVVVGSNGHGNGHPHHHANGNGRAHVNGNGNGHAEQNGNGHGDLSKKRLLVPGRDVIRRHPK